MRQPSLAVENNFTGGLKTEYTGLNFPENAATDTDNCIYTLIGEVHRRPGINFEEDYNSRVISLSGKAVSTYKWNNVGGDGSTQIVVVQAGNTIWFFRSSSATDSAPLSTTLLNSQVVLDGYETGAGNINTTECQYADGNGYLFIFSPAMNPIYCTYNAGVITANPITIKIRDFLGVPETVSTNTRPTSLTTPHNYNLFNQGWSTAPSFYITSLSPQTVTTGSKVFPISTFSGGTPTLGQQVRCASYPDHGLTAILVGTITAYSPGVSVTINITAAYPFPPTVIGSSVAAWEIIPINAGLINTWNTSQGTYPSNADIWWRFKNNSGVFDPSTTVPNVTLGSGPANKGFYIIDAFDQNRSSASGLSGLNNISTLIRPRTGTWFQGRVWYAGVDATQQAVGTAPYYTWTETIYFSQIVENVTQLGMCYQNNDPTSEEFFDLLPSDGGTITIQGSGSIYKLFPVQNGLLVFASNGIWFITGSQGIGFTANDYTVTKISEVKVLSGCSFVNVLGWPMFWNEEGIYSVTPAQQGPGLVVNNLCHGTILSYYADIAINAKIYARGDYDPINFTVTWVYHNDNSVDDELKYQFHKVLNFNTANKAFYPYTISTDLVPRIKGLIYVSNPGGPNTPTPILKYLTAIDSGHVTFSEENDVISYTDFFTSNNAGANFTSYFITGYKLHGKATFGWQPVYVRVFSNSSEYTAYKIQGIWDYANDPNTGRYSNTQLIDNSPGGYGIVYRKHKIRGNGISLQLKIQSVTGKPFHIIGWSEVDQINQVM